MVERNGVGRADRQGKEDLPRRGPNSDEVDHRPRPTGGDSLAGFSTTEPYGPSAFEVRAGQLLHIIDLTGGQVASMVAYSGRSHNEYLSPSATMTINASLTLKAGSRCSSSSRIRWAGMT